MMKHVCIALVVTLFGLPLWAPAQTRPFDLRGTSGPRGFGDAKPLRSVAPAGDAIALLHKRVDKIDWEEMPFEEVLDWLREEGDNRVNVLPRWLALNNDGVDEESLVTLRLTNSMVAEVLNEALEQLSEERTLQYRAVGNRIRISTKADFGRDLIQKVYSVNDILFQVPNFQQEAPQIDLTGRGAGGGGGGGGRGGGGGGGGGGQGSIFQTGGAGQGQQQQGQQGEGDREAEEKLEELKQTIIESIAPETWVENGGQGRISIFNRQLIVVNTIEVHEKLGGWFEPD